MRFWDTSAVVPLLVREAATETARDLLSADRMILAWWGSGVECVSALSRLEREEKLDSAGMSAAMGRLAVLQRSWHEVQPCERVRESAVRLLRVHDLRAADAFQLAAALTASNGKPSELAFVCLDERLRRAADREGLCLVPPVDNAGL